MSKRTTISITHAAHEALKARQGRLGSTSIGAALEEALGELRAGEEQRSLPQPTTGPTLHPGETAVAGMRSPGITVPPDRAPETGCRCDGPVEAGWWHKRSCDKHKEKP